MRQALRYALSRTLDLNLNLNLNLTYHGTREQLLGAFAL
jgi:hypothetical protein